MEVSDPGKGLGDDSRKELLAYVEVLSQFESIPVSVGSNGFFKTSFKCSRVDSSGIAFSFKESL